MAAAVSSIVFDDIFTIDAIDKEGKKFDRGPVFAFHRFFSSRSAQSRDYTPIQKIMIWI